MAQTIKKILVAEDELPLANALKLKLEHSGFEVDLAHDGEAALKQLTDKKYALCLLDLVMPKMDGFGVLEGAVKAKVSTPVVVLSNLSQDEDIDKAKKLGAKDFFVKSNMQLAEIVTKVDNLLK